jgi:hypothetical protein
VPPRIRADAILLVVLVLECAGALGVAVRDAGTSQQIGAALALLAAVVVAVRGDTRLAWVVAAWFATMSVLKAVAAVEPWAWLAPASQAPRWGLPIAIALPRHAMPILRASASLCFAGHGIEAIGLHPQFVAYIQHSGALVGLDLSALAAPMLRVIGSIDLGVAAAMLVRGPRPVAAGYMSIWACITALARTVYAGAAGIPDSLIRAGHVGAPLALLSMWRAARHHAEATSTSPP